MLMVELGCHSNTERPYLKSLQPRLESALNEYRTHQQLQEPEYKVAISEADAEPLQFV